MSSAHRGTPGPKDSAFTDTMQSKRTANLQGQQNVAKPSARICRPVVVYYVRAMTELICICACGHQFAVSEFAVGMEGRCERCGQPLKVTKENVTVRGVRREQPRRSYAAETPADRDMRRAESGPTACTRCGSAFRGDWDMYQGPSGAVCHRCAHMAELHDPSTGPPRPIPLKQFETLEPVIETDHAEPGPPQKQTFLEWFDEFKRTKLFRSALWVAALSTIACAILFSFTDLGAPPTDTTGGAGSSTGGIALFGSPENLTRAQARSIAYVVFGCDLAFGLLAMLGALFLTLHWAGRLPSCSIAGNLLHVGFFALVVAFVTALISFSFGSFLPMIGTALAYGVTLYILYELYDLRFSDIATFIVLRIVFGLLVTPLRMLVYGIAANLLF